ncbi:Uncharacterized protein SCF082_LOCUS28818 [Durusdinium trenchii]|uniref:Uncharacterized protein n=1 Tax=Durusdinium trenchii TaxID=1381693 RepID=A0ABP0MMM7_9DINO
MSPTASGDNGTWSIDASIPDSDDQALTELLICLDGSDGKVPTSLPPGWDKASAVQRLSDHLQLIDSEIARKLKGLEDLNTHLAGLQSQGQELPNPAPLGQAGGEAPWQGRAELAAQHSAPCCGVGGHRLGVGPSASQLVHPGDHMHYTAYTPSAPQPPAFVATAAQPQIQQVRNWYMRTASPSPAYQRLSSTPATFRGRVYKVAGTASTGCFVTVPSVPTIRTASPVVTVRADSAGAGTRRVAPVTYVGGPAAGPPGSPRVVLGHSPDSRTRCNSPPAALPRHGSRPPRAGPAPVSQQPWQHPPPAQSHVSSRFILVSHEAAAAAGMERCATPRRVPSRPPGGISPARPVIHRMQTPRT